MSQVSAGALEARINQISVVTAEGLRELCACAQPCQLLKKQFLFQAGEICQSIYFVEKGYVRAFYQAENGQQVNSRFYFEDDFATDLQSLRTKQPAKVSLLAEEEVQAWEWSKETLLQVFAASAELAAFERHLLGHLLLKQEAQTQLFQHHGPAERYEQLVRDNPQVIQRVSLSQLASYLGMARETLSRLRNPKL